MPQQGPDPHVAASFWNDDIWNELLDYLEDGRVIPIVGPDLLLVKDGDTPILLDRYLARELAARCNLSTDHLGSEPTLNGVVCQLLQSDRTASKPYSKIRDILKKSSFAPPRPLRRLAEITHFNLFVSTTFDSFLEDALNQVRFGSREETLSLAYAPNNVKDLDAQDNRDRPTVYHLLGKLTTAPTSVICDEDLLEFVCALQSETRRPERLFDELKEKHLLLLGEDFPDWLARFFLRTARQHKLIESRDRLQILADDHTSQDQGLVSFLQHFSNGTRIFQGGGAIEFVDQLWQRWRERNPAAADKPLLIPPPAEMPPGAIFISYASENLAAAQELKAGLDAAGLPAWFDKEQLKAGQNFDLRIEQNINNCSYFVPLLSRETETRLRDAYFRREWTRAAQRSEGIDPNKEFMIPVVIDETVTFSHMHPLPANLHQQRLLNGKTTPEFIARMQELYQGWCVERTARKS